MLIFPVGYVVIGLLLYRFAMGSAAFEGVPPFQRLMALFIFLVGWPIVSGWIIYSSCVVAKRQLQAERMLADVLRRGKRFRR